MRWQRLLVAYINTIFPFLCCNKTPNFIWGGNAAAERLQFVASLTARCCNVFNFLPKYESKIPFGLLERNWEFTFSVFPFLLPVMKIQSPQLEKPPGPWGIAPREWCSKINVASTPDGAELSFKTWMSLDFCYMREK